MNETLAELKLQQRRDKTFIGRISRGFDLLGYLFTPAGLEVPRGRWSAALSVCPGFMD